MPFPWKTTPSPIKHFSVNHSPILIMTIPPLRLREKFAMSLHKFFTTRAMLVVHTMTIKQGFLISNCLDDCLVKFVILFLHKLFTGKD